MPLGVTAPESPAIAFEDIARRAGVNFVLQDSATPNKHQIETMVGGVAEYLSLATGFRFLLLVVAVFYIASVLTRRQPAAVPAPAGIK